jgi:predicted PurR-regulated permease PerM
LRDFGKITEIKPPQLPGVRGLLSLAVGVVVITALAMAKEVFVPITLAILLSFILAPLVSAQTRIHVPRILAVLVAALCAVVFFAVIGSVIGAQFAGLAKDLPHYATQIETKIDTLRQKTIARFPVLEKSWPAHVLPGMAQEKPAAAPAPAQSAPAASTESAQPTDPVRLAMSILVPALAPIAEAAIVGIVAIFILFQKNDLRDRIIRLFGTRDLHRTTVAMDEAARRLSHYFLAQLAVNTGFGFVIGCGLALIGIPSPGLFGILAGILRFVPYVGVVMAAALPAALAAAASPHWAMMWWTLALVVGVEAVTGQLVEPIVYGNTTGLSPLSIVVAAIFWTWLWGPIGLVLATPLTLCLVVLGRYVEHFEFLDVLFGDQPALTPVENFYQRMLARDPDEALHQADILLKQMSLSAYYDDVAISGLRLAAYDAERGVLHSDDVERLKQSVLSLVEDLEDYDDEPPQIADSSGPSAAAPAKPEANASGQLRLSEPAAATAPVICIPGRGVFDEIVAHIFVQLLKKRNIPVRLEISFATARYQNVDEQPNPAAICVMYLEIRNNSTAARAMVRRLAQRQQDSKIVVGLWSGDSKERQLSSATSMQGVHAVGSLQEALTWCTQLVSGEIPSMARELMEI